jgi:hypothetical protein
MLGVALVLYGVNGAQIAGVAATDPDASRTLNVVGWSFEVVISWPAAAFMFLVWIVIASWVFMQRVATAEAPRPAAAAV